MARSREIAGKLFVHMTNFVASNHGWHKGGDMIPSAYLDAELTKDQIDLLNPTARDVQLGAILDQCIGQKAKKIIAKRRIDIVTGNVNSYARMLNGPTQLEKSKHTISWRRLLLSCSGREMPRNWRVSLKRRRLIWRRR